MPPRVFPRFLPLVAAVSVGCLASEPPAVPLYPNGETTRLPPNQVADLTGPIGKIDGRGKTIAAFGGELAGVCLDFYGQDALYGETAEEAFRIETGPSVNTPNTTK